MTFPELSTQSFRARHSRLTVDADGFYVDAHGVKLGVVVFAWREETIQVLCVRKSDKAGYVFSGKWALPGGMVRAETGDQAFGDLLDAVYASAARRCVSEAGLLVSDRTALSLIDMATPVTCFDVDRIRQFVRVVPLLFSGPTPDTPESADSSITDARWWLAQDVLPLMSPANCVVLHGLVGSLLPSAYPGLVAAVGVAKAQCDTWEAEALARC